MRLWGVHHIGVISRTRSDRLGRSSPAGPFALRPQSALPRQHRAVGRLRADARGSSGWRRSSSSCSALEYHAIVRWEERCSSRGSARRTATTPRACRGGCRRLTAQTADRASRSPSDGFSWRDDALQRARHAHRDRRWLRCCSGSSARLNSERLELRRRDSDSSSLKASTSERLPQIPRRDRSVRPPRLADLQHALRVRPLAQPVQPLHRVDDARGRRPGSTSGRCRRNIRNISAVQRPNPFTATSRSMTCFVGQRLELVELQPSVDDARATDRAGSRPSVRSARRRRSACVARARRSPPRPECGRRETARRSGRRSSRPPSSTAAG